MRVPVSPVISEFFANGYVLRHQLCKSTPFKKKMIESSPILEVREKSFRDSTYSSVTYLGLLLLVPAKTAGQTPRATHLGKTVTVMPVLTTGQVRLLHMLSPPCTTRKSPVILPSTKTERVA